MPNSENRLVLACCITYKDTIDIFMPDYSEGGFFKVKQI